MWEDNLEPAPLLNPEKILIVATFRNTTQVIWLDLITFFCIEQVLSLSLIAQCYNTITITKTKQNPREEE